MAVKKRTVENIRRNDPISGNYISLLHEDGTRTLYLHLKTIQATPGGEVRAGQKIGEVGKTGRVTGAHLHLIFRGKDGIDRNPHEAVKLAASRAQNSIPA